MDNTLTNLLTQERNALTDRIAVIEGEMGKLQGELVDAQRRLAHIIALLGDGDVADTAAPSSTAVVKANNGTALCDLAEAALRENGGVPMHYKDLTREVMARGGVLGGQQPWGRLVARMISDGRFIRPTSKGFYALREDYPTARNVGARRFRRRAAGKTNRGK